MTSPGLLFVYGEPGELVSEKEFNDWYDGEHIPARATVPGFLTLRRYKAADGLKPTWLALYDIASPEVTVSEAYTKLPAAASDNERKIVSNLPLLNRRVYSSISSKMSPTARDSDIPAKFIIVALMTPTSESESEFNRWYEEEHLPLLSKVPGWIRGRRYKLVNEGELGGKAGGAEKWTKPGLTYLATHDLTTLSARETEEWNQATNTPWRTKVMEGVVGRELRVFELYKDFPASG